MEFDYVIVGAGSAGCVLANRLSADPANRVCLLEAGLPDTSPLIHAPGGLLFIVPPSKFNWSYETTPQPGLNGRRGYQPRGKTLGGSSAINAMVYIRGHATDYDDWAELGNHDWSYEKVLPWFKKSENYHGGENTYHGQGGELSVSKLNPQPATVDFVDAAKSRGYHENLDFNGAQQEGVGVYDVTIRDGSRCSAAVGFLHPIRQQRSNLTVITEALAQRVIMEGTKAVGVSVSIKGQEHQIKAQREVIVAGGAFGSPQLLMLSGIGDPADMTPHGIKTVHQLPGVGKGLVDHPDYVQAYRSPDRSLNGLSITGAWTMFKAWGEYKKHKTGRWASNYAEAGGFLKTQSTLSRPDIQLHWLTGQADDHGRKKLWGHGLSCHVCVLRPKSKGSVTLASANPADAPLINPNFLSHDDDVKVLLDGFKMVREIMESDRLTKYKPQELFSSVGKNDEQLINLLRQRTDTVYHPVSTCRMGDDEMAVVDQRLRVHGLQNLRVIDASIFPTLMGGNTNAPTIMVAERGAEMILQDHQA